MFEVSEKSRKANGKFEGSKVVPFSAELQKFFTLSRECQTQFSYIDESHRSRKFQFCEKNSIKEFITYTMFFKKWNEVTSLLCTNEEEVVKNITEKMIQESRKYNSEVHFNVIWVYFFTYRDEGINSLPVFKIHYGRGNGAVYLDAFSKVYQTWDCYIDGPDLGESLLCVPRNGEYYFDEGKLSLEFVQTKNIQFEYISSSSPWVKLVVPAFQNLQNWASELRAWLSNCPEVNSVVKKILSFFKDNMGTVIQLAAAILLAYFDPYLKTNSQLAEWGIKAAKIICMFHTSQVFEKFLPGIDIILAGKFEYYPEAREILVLLNKPSKNWVEIMDAVCCLIKKIRGPN